MLYMPGLSSAPIPPITTGIIISDPLFSSRFLFSELADNSNIPHGSYYLLIYALYPKVSRITIYPLGSSDVWKLSFVFSQVDETLLNQVYQKFDTPLLHTTGISQKEEEFQVELYLPPQRTVELPSLLAQFDSIPEVTKVTGNLVVVYTE